MEPELMHEREKGERESTSAAHREIRLFLLARVVVVRLACDAVHTDCYSDHIDIVRLQAGDNSWIHGDDEKDEICTVKRTLWRHASAAGN